MRTFPSLRVLLGVLLTFISLSSAWPWPPSIRETHRVIQRRQQESSVSSSVPTSASAQKTTDSSRPTATATDTRSESGSITSKATFSGTGSASASGTSDSADSAASTGDDQSGSTKPTDKPSATTDVDPRLPAGGVEMITPPAIAGLQLYKVGDFVTFAWNYTSLVVTPSGIDIIASCSANNQAYTIATNQSVGPTGAVTWDTRPSATASAPLLTEKYTLMIYDAAKGVSATAQAGYLGTFSQLVFGMYTPQHYVPLDEWVCVTCSSALSDMERHTLSFMLTMGAITVLTFTWFAGESGVLW